MYGLFSIVITMTGVFIEKVRTFYDFFHMLIVINRIRCHVTLLGSHFVVVFMYLESRKSCWKFTRRSYLHICLFVYLSGY